MVLDEIQESCYKVFKHEKKSSLYLNRALVPFLLAQFS